jgi:hypothetical protein
MYRGVLSSGLGSHWRREVLRTSLWFVPALEVRPRSCCSLSTIAVDRAAYHGDFTLPGWVIQRQRGRGPADPHHDRRRIIAVVGVVFSIILVTRRWPRPSSGPRMLTSSATAASS